ncbi:MAG: hypothetical protein ACM3VX_02230 [Bacteroidota bacterium]
MRARAAASPTLLHIGNIWNHDAAVEVWSDFFQFGFATIVELRGGSSRWPCRGKS